MKPTINCKQYTAAQKRLHEDIVNLVTSKPYKAMDADDMSVVFGRVYALFLLDQLRHNGIIEVKKKVNA